ncbi:MAG: S41 family peptidase [Verrucomicrobia bacterium]|nr:S41 family peptidase [Verrucomicrobiota bacterium]
MNLRSPLRLSLACFVAVASASAGLPEDATPVRLVACPAISPDGKQVVFEWLDELWSATTEGGEAVPLTAHPAQDTRPRFTPDGQRVVFSSNRGGSFQVFSMAADGGEPVQHSHHSEGGLLECLAPDGKRAIISGSREHAGCDATRLLEIDLTRERRERCLFDAQAKSAACAPDGTRVLFCRGGEPVYRKGEAGPRASQLWCYEENSKSFTRQIPAATDVHSPLWHRDGKGFYYVSRIDGVANLGSYREATQTSRQLTFSKDEGVSQPDVSADGATFVLLLGWQLCRFRPATDAAPVPLELWTRAKLPEVSRLPEWVDGTSDADYSPAPEQVVFAAAGDLWWLTKGRNPPTRLTATPAAESEVRLSRDGTWLSFLRDDGLEANYCRATLEHGRLGEVRQVTHGIRSKCRLQASPDESKLAWVEGNGEVWTAAADGSKPTRVFQCWDRPTFVWSPCGRWLALAAKDKNSNRDIWLTAADGSRPPLNLTRHPAFEGSPRWSPDGRYLVFTARRDPSGKLGLWRIDFGIHGLAPDLPEAAISRLGDLAVPLSTRGIEPHRVLWAGDSKSLFFQGADPAQPQLHALSSSGKSMTVVAQQRGVPVRVGSDGSLLWLADGCPALLKQGALTRFPIAMTVERRREDVLRLGFRRIWRTLGERFYDPAMTGTDWPALREKYEALAVAARDSRQFDRVVGLLLGELQASHLSFAARVWPTPFSPRHPEEPTAHPGLVFRDEAGDGPLVVGQVLPGSPVSQVKEPPQPGEVVTRIAGQEVDTHTPLHRLFMGALGCPMPLVLRATDGRLRVLELRCISYPQARALDHLAREARCRTLVGNPPRPRLAYLPLPRMEPADLQHLELEIYRASLDHDGLILDLRDNGGGNAADQLLALFCQPIHSFTIPRDGPVGYPTERRAHPAWDHPMVVLCNENTCSNAEVFCHAIQQSGRAALIGSVTAGSVVSALDETIPDLGRLQVPFRRWFDARTGEDLERHGAVPEHPVPHGPADDAAGQDPQLQRALEVLRETIARVPGG